MQNIKEYLRIVAARNVNRYGLTKCQNYDAHADRET